MYLGSVGRAFLCVAATPSIPVQPLRLQPAGGKHICLTDPKGISS